MIFPLDWLASESLWDPPYLNHPQTIPTLIRYAHEGSIHIDLYEADTTRIAAYAYYRYYERFPVPNTAIVQHITYKKDAEGLMGVISNMDEVNAFFQKKVAVGPEYLEWSIDLDISNDGDWRCHKSGEDSRAFWNWYFDGHFQRSVREYGVFGPRKLRAGDQPQSHDIITPELHCGAIAAFLSGDFEFQRAITTPVQR